jgi:hypothetical protein
MKDRLAGYNYRPAEILLGSSLALDRQRFAPSSSQWLVVISESPCCMQATQEALLKRLRQTDELSVSIFKWLAKFISRECMDRQPAGTCGLWQGLLGPPVF